MRQDSEIRGLAGVFHKDFFGYTEPFNSASIQFPHLLYSAYFHWLSPR
jgi:hypothetical protein